MDRLLARSSADLVWGLWKELGVPGVVRLPHPPVLDVEWLLVHTPFLAANDPRLDELAFGWCAQHHNRVSTRRLRSVAERVEPEVADLFWAWAAELRSVARINWVKADDATPSSRNIRRIRLDITRSPLVALRVRAVFGVGARADIICELLAKEGQWLRASEFVEVGYTKSTAITVLSDLARARVLSSTARSNATVYTLGAGTLLKDLLDAHDSTWINWGQVFGVITRLVRLEADGEKPDAVLRVYADQARRDLESLVVALGWPALPKTTNVSEGYQAMMQWGADRLGEVIAPRIDGLTSPCS